jgi:hypothetical protein
MSFKVLKLCVGRCDVVLHSKVTWLVVTPAFFVRMRSPHISSTQKDSVSTRIQVRSQTDQVMSRIIDDFSI